MISLMSRGEQIIILQYKVVNLTNYQRNTNLSMKLNDVKYMKNNDGQI